MNSLDKDVHNIDQDKLENHPLLRPSLEYAMILSIIGILALVVPHYMQIDPNSMVLKIVNWSAAIAGVFWFIWHYKTKRNHQVLEFGSGIRLSALTGLFTGLFTAVGVFVFMSWIAPDYTAAILETSIRSMREQGQSDAVIEQSLPFIKIFTSPAVIAAFVVLGTLISYVIIGLIATAIMKKERS